MPATLDLQDGVLRDLWPRIEARLLGKYSLFRVGEWIHRPNNWTMGNWEPTANNPYDQHPIFTLRLVCKRFARMFRSHVAMCCAPYSTRKLRYKGKKIQSEPHFMKAFMYHYMHVRTILVAHGMSAEMRDKLQDFCVAVFHNRVARITQNTNDDLAGKLYFALRETITEYLGDERGKGLAGDLVHLRRHLFEFFFKLAAPLDALIEQRAYVFKQERKRRKLAWYLQQFARFGDAQA